MSKEAEMKLKREVEIRNKDVVDVAIELISEQSERIRELEKLHKSASSGLFACDRNYDYVLKQNRRYSDVINSMISEIKYALYTNKPIDIKEQYLKNAERYGKEALEGELE